MAVQRALLVCLAAAAFVFQLALAVDHTVGAPAGSWDTTTDLQTWVGSQNFLVGDRLIFMYTSNHDVLEVTAANYASCSTGSPIATHTGGNTVIGLSAPGKRYFICGTAGHCQQGMKIEVDTTAAAGTPPSGSSPGVPSAESPGSSPPPPPPASSNGVSLKTCLAVGLGLMLMMLLAL